jgi:hypothetical protein
MNDSGSFVRISEEDLINEAIGIVDTAQGRGVCLRILGALAVYIHSRESAECIDTFKSLGRLGEGNPIFTDVDLIGYSKQENEVKKMLQDLHFKPAGMVNTLFAGRRLLYSQSEEKYKVDIFMNRLEFSHDVEFGNKPGNGRLELDYPTITLADIVLEKLQIHQINRKDLIDLIVLFLGHNIGDGDNKEVIDGAHIARVLSGDWGFWYEATSNIEKLRQLISQFERAGNLPVEYTRIISERIDGLVKMVKDAPRSEKWRKRAKNGTNKPWFREVDEIVR